MDTNERLEQAIASETTVRAISKKAKVSNSMALRYLKAKGNIGTLRKPRTIQEVA
jgi:hypothetical protein